MYFLDRNEYQFDLPETCLRLLREEATSLLTHYSRSFEQRVKSPITQRLSEIYGVPEENILLGYGCEDLLTQIVQYFLQRGDRILVARYAWWYYKKIAEQVDGVTVEFPVEKNETVFHARLEDILAHVRQHTPKMILLANPNNPTGDAIPLPEIESLIQTCPETIVVLDESYWGFEEKDESHVQRFLTLYPNAIILRTFSKFYGLPGARIGFGFVHSDHGSLIRRATRYLGFNRLSEALALAALDATEHYEAMNRLLYNEKRRYYEVLRRLPGVKVYESRANFVLIGIPPRVVPRLKENFTKAGILVRFFDSNGLENHFRVSIAKPEVNDLVFRCIQEAVEGA